MKENKRNSSFLPKEVKEALDRDPQPLTGEFERVWDLIGITDNEPIVTDPDQMDQRWASLQSLMTDNDQAPTVPPPLKVGVRANDRQASRLAVRRAPVRRVWSAVAAALFLALTTGYIYWQVPVTHSAPYGETTNVLLSDGSTVELNSGSTLSYKRGFDGLPFFDADERLVELNGEAFFKVVPSTTPFRINTFNANVQVLGTEFNIKAWPDLDQGVTAVALASGRVQVASGAETEGVILDQPGEISIVSDANAAPSSPTIDRLERILIWRDQGFAVQNQTLRSVFSELELRFGVTITVQDEQILRDSLSILLSKPGSVEAILDDICNTMSLRYRPVSRGYEIYRP